MSLPLIRCAKCGETVFKVNRHQCIPPKPDHPKIVVQREDGCGGAVVVGAAMIIAIVWAISR